MSRSCRLRELKITKGFLMLCVQMACCAVLVSACAPFSYVGEEAEEVKETAANDETAYEGTTIEDDRKTEMISVTKHERYAEIILRRGMHFIK